MNVYPDSATFAQMADSLVAVCPPDPATLPPAFMSGIEPVAAMNGAGDNSVLVALLVGLAVLLMFCTRGVRRTLQSYKGELWSLRRRQNVFDAETGISVPVAFLLGITFVVYSATDVYIGLAREVAFNLNRYLQITALFCGFYIFKLCAYSLVGYSFAEAPRGRQWITGFNAAMAFVGLFLVIPTLAALYIAQVADFVLYYCLIVWLIGQIIFICKGFRIFYRNYRSIFYFFLYLCTLEIIPLFALASGVLSILHISAV